MNKYHARKVIVDGVTFDSQAEAYRYRELQLMQSAGEISNLHVHPRFIILDGFELNGKKERPIIYEADFMYNECGFHIVEDVKGGAATQTPVFKLKRKMFLSRYKNNYVFRVVEK